jgi:hypothetical protein
MLLGIPFLTPDKSGLEIGLDRVKSKIFHLMKIVMLVQPFNGENAVEEILIAASGDSSALVLIRNKN